MRDLADAEAAHDLERERDARLARQDRVAREEHHRELIVVGRRRLAAQPGGGRRIAGARDHRGRRDRLGLHRRQAIAGRGLELDQPLLAPQQIERAVLRHLNQPGRRVGRRALVRPELQRLDERVLRRFLGQRQMPRAEDPRERRDDVREVVLEVQIVDHGRVTSTSRTSMLP